MNKTKNCTRYLLLLAAGVAGGFAGLGSGPAAAATPDELEAAVQKIDTALYAQCEADVRAWLDARIAKYGDFGVFPDLPELTHVVISDDGRSATFNLSRGGICDAGAQLFRAYEMLGDEKYLRAGLKTADALLAVQQPAGYFASGHHPVSRDGKVTVGGESNVIIIADGGNFRPFAYLLYAYRLSGEKKYFEAARRCADLFVEQIQHPEYGWCPEYGKAEHLKRHAYLLRAHDGGGGCYNDYATTDPLRMTIMMYHLTGEKKYLARSAKIGDWMFATQLGEGEVRGWCQQYRPDNSPDRGRGFEQAVIGPRTFNRFVGPMLTWFHGMTGEERYRTLFEETYRWMRSVEQPDNPGEPGVSFTRDFDKLVALYARDFLASRAAPRHVASLEESGKKLRFDRQFTVMAKFRTESNDTLPLVAKSSPTGQWSRDAKVLMVRGGKLVYDIGWLGEMAGHARVNDGKEHVAVLRMNDAGVHCFLDGRKDAEKDAKFRRPDKDDHVFKVGTASVNFGGFCFEGEIATVRFWMRALSDEEVRALSTGKEDTVNAPDFNWSGNAAKPAKPRELAETKPFVELAELSRRYPSGGWAYQYQPDGTPIFSIRTRGYDGASFRYDQPEKWPRAGDLDQKNWAGLVYNVIHRSNRAKMQIDDSQQVLEVLQAGGLEALRNWYKGPKKLDPGQYLQARLEAARRCTDTELVVPLRGRSLEEGVNGRVMGNYLERVRLRLARPDALWLPAEDTLHSRTGLARQSWQSIHTWNEPYRPPYGWAQWQFLWDARLALGKIDADTAATGGRGLEAMHYYPRWDVMGDWTTRAVEVEDWMNVPLGRSD